MKNNINYQKKLDERNPFEYAKATNDARFSHLLKRMHSLKLMVYLLMGIIVALIFCCFTLITASDSLCGRSQSTGKSGGLWEDDQSQNDKG